MSTNKIVNLLGTILGITLFIILITGITYAWFTWRSSDISISGSSECFTINHTVGENISQTINDIGVILFDESKIINENQITIKEGMGLTYVTAAINSDCSSIDANLTINLNTTSLNSAYTSLGNSTGAFKYVIANYDPSTYSTVTTSALKDRSFDIIKTGSITNTDPIELVNEILSTTTKGYLIIFYVDGDLALNDAQYSTFSGTIEAIATQVES